MVTLYMVTMVTDLSPIVCIMMVELVIIPSSCNNLMMRHLSQHARDIIIASYNSVKSGQLRTLLVHLLIKMKLF